VNHRSSMGRSRIIGTAVSVLVIALVIAAAALARTSAGRAVTSSLGLRTAREPFTALSFADSLYVGIHGVTYRKQDQRLHDRFAFRIRNEEHRTITYRWRVAVHPSTPASAGRVAVASGHTATVRTQVELSCALNQVVARQQGQPIPGRVEVTVALQPSGDRIDFWRSCGD
jgi:hypothetical protein